MKKNALGRGLDALLPQADYAGSLRELPLRDIDLNPAQPRKQLDQDSLQQLADSIREVGVLQPILVQPVGNRYRIIAGERRFRAATLAGLSTIPAVERDMEALEGQLAALVENLQRENLNPMEQAQAIQLLMAAGSYTQEQAAQRLGKSRPAVANLLRLLNLSEEVQAMVRDGSLSEGHARVLAGVKSAARQIQLARQAVAQGLSVRELEALSRKVEVKPATARRSVLPPELADLERRLHRATGVRTKVEGNLEAGRIQLSYRSAQELEQLYQALEGILE